MHLNSDANTDTPTTGDDHKHQITINMKPQMVDSKISERDQDQDQDTAEQTEKITRGKFKTTSHRDPNAHLRSHAVTFHPQIIQTDR